MKMLDMQKEISNEDVKTMLKNMCSLEPSAKYELPSGLQIEKLTADFNSLHINYVYETFLKAEPTTKQRRKDFKEIGAAAEKLLSKLYIKQGEGINKTPLHIKERLLFMAGEDAKKLKSPTSAKLYLNTVLTGISALRIWASFLEEIDETQSPVKQDGVPHSGNIPLDNLFMGLSDIFEKFLGENATITYVDLTEETTSIYWDFLRSSLQIFPSLQTLSEGAILSRHKRLRRRIKLK